jgi:hypothetical protein
VVEIVVHEGYFAIRQYRLHIHLPAREHGI